MAELLEQTEGFRQTPRPEVDELAERGKIQGEARSAVMNGVKVAIFAEEFRPESWHTQAAGGGIFEIIDETNSVVGYTKVENYVSMINSAPEILPN